MRSLGLKIAVMFVLLAAAACSSEAERRGSPPLSSPPQSPSPTPTASAAGAARPPVEATEAIEADADGSFSFLSPTRNIACSMSGANAVCEIREHTFDSPPQPSDCELDFGTMVAIEGRQPARFLCHGDTGFGGTDSVLAYGDSLTTGLATCTSRESGMTCTSADGGHGFELSRGSYRLY